MTTLRYRNKKCFVLNWFPESLGTCHFKPSKKTPGTIDKTKYVCVNSEKKTPKVVEG